MGLQIRDDRQMKAVTGLSQAQVNPLLPVFSTSYQATQQKTYAEGLTSGTRVRKPGGGGKGHLPTMAEKLLFVLYDYKTSPPCDVLGTQFDRVRSKANDNLHTLSPLFYATLGHGELMPYREFETPEAMNAAGQGIEQVIMDATERTERRSPADAQQRAHESGQKTPYVEKPRHVAPGQMPHLSRTHIERA